MCKRSFAFLPSSFLSEASVSRWTVGRTDGRGRTDGWDAGGRGFEGISVAHCKSLLLSSSSSAVVKPTPPSDVYAATRDAPLFVLVMRKFSLPTCPKDWGGIVCRSICSPRRALLKVSPNLFRTSPLRCLFVRSDSFLSPFPPPSCHSNMFSASSLPAVPLCLISSKT